MRNWAFHPVSFCSGLMLRLDSSFLAALVAVVLRLDRLPDCGYPLQVIQQLLSGISLKFLKVFAFVGLAELLWQGPMRIRLSSNFLCE